MVPEFLKPVSPEYMTMHPSTPVGVIPELETQRASVLHRGAKRVADENETQ
jgi:hypothetical protein